VSHSGGVVHRAAAGAGLARLAWAVLTAAPPGGIARWQRTNHRGDRLTLLEGPAFAAAATTATVLAADVPPRLRAAGAVATVGAAAFGLLDDLGERGASKGLRGHLGELARGRLTTGGAKVLGIGVTGLVAAALALPGADDGAEGGRGRRALDVLAAGALVAGSANLLNLLDLRPGRALKATLLAGVPLAAGGPAAAARLAAAAVGPAVALLPEDLAERAMLGDTGANAAGALLGTALVAGSRRGTRLAALAVVVGLTLASERWSFTKVIEATPGLRELDAVGRRPR
jgi:UDP-N-acetylmuramyl pentapeptide phosphotransferase/UDP-N-acetylglucosamine-1-phosphate transferase